MNPRSTPPSRPANDRSSTTASGVRRYRSFMMDNARWDEVPLRDDDIVVATPAKTGTTWLQTICVMLVLGPPPWQRPLGEISPWLDMTIEPITEVASRLEAQTHRRVIKSHTPLDGLPTRPGLRYLVIGRDPRDVALSWGRHFNNIDLERAVELRFRAVGADDLDELGIDPSEPPSQVDDPVAQFRQFVDNADLAIQGGSLRGFAHTIRQAWDARNEDDVLLLHYADLRADLPTQLRRIADFLDVDLDEHRIPTLVEAAGFDAMRSNAGHFAPAAEADIWQDTDAFFRRGQLGGWRELPEDLLQHYEHRAAQLLPTDLRRWLERG